MSYGVSGTHWYTLAPDMLEKFPQLNGFSSYLCLGWQMQYKLLTIIVKDLGSSLEPNWLLEVDAS